MPDQEPFIIPSTDPFKVEATPAKFGGVDARAKRPLDMSGKAVSLSDHLEPVDASPAQGDETAWLPAESSRPGGSGAVALPESTAAASSPVPISGGEPMVDSHALLPDAGHHAQGVQGPLVQDALDTRHREQFDDPSRFLRTDTKVRLPSARPLQRHQTVPTLPSGRSGRILVPPQPLLDAGIDHLAVDESSQAMAIGPQAAESALTARPDGAQLAAALAALATPAATVGSPEQRRQSFNQRLTQILSDQQQITEDLSAVEQAALLTRAQIQDASPDEPSKSD